MSTPRESRRFGDVAGEGYFSKTPSGDVVETATLTVILLATYVSRPKTGP